MYLFMDDYRPIVFRLVVGSENVCQQIAADASKSSVNGIHIFEGSFLRVLGEADNSVMRAVRHFGMSHIARLAKQPAAF